MDTGYLETAFKAFADTVRAIISEEKDPHDSTTGKLSPDGVKYYNSIAKSFNEKYSENPLMIFREETNANSVLHPKAAEMLGQIKLALTILDEKGEKMDSLKKKPSSKQGKPSVFIGCSVEGLNVAKIVQLNLEHNANTTIWHQGVFGLSKGTLETLVEKCTSFDYAVLVLSQDDIVISRGDMKMGARDNVLFELGLFMGAIGRNNTFIICENNTILPSDLAGITPAYYSLEGKDNLVAALGPVCTKLEIEMAML